MGLFSFLNSGKTRALQEIQKASGGSEPDASRKKNARREERLDSERSAKEEERRAHREWVRMEREREQNIRREEEEQRY